LSAAPEQPTRGAAARGEGQNGFSLLPLDLIIVEEQVRTSCDLESESFNALKDSIAEEGGYQPVTVIPREEQYLLILGRRLFLACRQLGMAAIPAYIRRDIETKEDILTAQLIENLQREDLNPIDAANGILAIFQIRHNDLDLGAVIKALLNYDRDQGRVKNAFTDTVSVIIKSCGKTARTIENRLSLLKHQRIDPCCE
jgi:hypothetical protein